MNNDLLNDVLNELHNNTPTLQAAGVMSVDGLTLAACFPSFMDEDRFGNLSAGLHSLSSSAALLLDRGKLDHIVVQGENGNLIMVRAGLELLVAAMAQPDSELTAVLQNIKQAAEKIRNLFI